MSDQGEIIRQNLVIMAKQLSDVLQVDAGIFDKDERDALSIAAQLLNWVSKPPEVVIERRKKPGIAFGNIQLGDGWPEKK